MARKTAQYASEKRAELTYAEVISALVVCARMVENQSVRNLVDVSYFPPSLSKNKQIVSIPR
jgi:hypothetical protein